MDNTTGVNKKIVWRNFAPAFIVVLNSLVWYPLVYAVFTRVTDGLHLVTFQTNLLFGAYFAAIAGSAVFGAWLFPRARKMWLALWMVLGAVMSVSLVTIPSNDLLSNLFISIFLGISIGIGLPSTLGYFADEARIEKRGLLGGITWSAVGFSVLIGAVLVNMVETTTLGIGLLVVWRILGLVFLLLIKEKKDLKCSIPSASYRRILGRRDVVLYLVPWAMFSLVNFAETPILTIVLGDFSAFAVFVTFALTGIFALVGGILADRLGRKRIVIAGFVVLGIEYAVLSLFSTNPASWYVYMVFDGIAWGMFAAVFFMTLWGDLAGDNGKEKYYVVGGLPYLLAGFLPILIEPYVDFIQPTAAFSIASFFLFIAVLPLVYAPETLPEKLMKDRDLKNYIEKALKHAQKEAEKNHKNGKPKPEKEPEKTEQEAAEESLEDEEARKLAEKYY